MTSTVSGPAYRIHTPRLVLRCWQPEDAPLLKTAIDASLEHLRPWMPWAHQEPADIETKIALLRRFRGEFDLGKDFVYGVFSRDEKQVLGGTGLHLRLGEGAREIGYWIHQEHVGRGLATELTSALTKVAFEVDGVERVEIHCDPENHASAAVARKSGFIHEKTVQSEMEDGELDCSMIWVMRADAYPASPAAEAEVEALDVIGRRVL
ncbi:MAG: GNAT family N-acetyltransferase [Anaerolineae bacterium]|nr:GNAT family N-acetyltransferase [Anaerolineae bacterium]